MKREADWYFDFVSPYPYLQMTRFSELPEDVVIQPRPILFAALLNHWGHKGPAEIPAKRRQTAIYTRWLANTRGLPFKGPPRHPFNPLALLRLSLVAGGSMEVVQTIYAHVWGEGNDGQDHASIAALAEKLGIVDVTKAISDQSIKDAIRTNTEEAIAQGVYGVPTLAYKCELFWGDDITPMFEKFLEDPDMFTRDGFSHIEEIVPAATR